MGCRSLGTRFPGVDTGAWIWEPGGCEVPRYGYRCLDLVTAARAAARFLDLGTARSVAVPRYGHQVPRFGNRYPYLGTACPVN